MGQIIVRRYDVADILAELDRPFVDLLMVDLRGAEALALAALREPLAAGLVRWMVVATAHHVRSGRFVNHLEVVAAVADAGGSVLLDRAPEESLGPAGLVIAAFGDGPAATGIDVSWVRPRDSFHGSTMNEAEAIRGRLIAAAEEAGVLAANLGAARDRIDALEAALARADGERDLLVTQLAHARHQRDEAAKGISAVVGRRSTEALRGLKARVARG
jgi:hypothetical protein